MYTLIYNLKVSRLSNAMHLEVKRGLSGIVCHASTASVTGLVTVPSLRRQKSCRKRAKAAKAAGCCSLGSAVSACSKEDMEERLRRLESAFEMHRSGAGESQKNSVGYNKSDSIVLAGGAAIFMACNLITNLTDVGCAVAPAVHAIAQDLQGSKAQHVKMAAIAKGSAFAALGIAVPSF